MAKATSDTMQLHIKANVPIKMFNLNLKTLFPSSTVKTSKTQIVSWSGLPKKRSKRLLRKHGQRWKSLLPAKSKPLSLKMYRTARVNHPLFGIHLDSRTEKLG